MKSLFNKIVGALSKVHGTGRIVTVVYTSKPRTTKKSRATKEPASFAEVTKTKRFVFRPGDFAGGKLDESGEAELPRGFERVTGEITGDDVMPVYRSINRDELAIGVPPASGFANSKATFKIDGRDATDEEITDLRENYLDKPREGDAPKWQMLLESRIETVKVDGQVLSV